MFDINENKHLGGHNNNNAMLPNEIKFLQAKFNIKSMVDIGCGPAWMVELANHLGIHAIGIEGDQSVGSKEYIKFHDFTHGPYEIANNFDLAYSVEFLEHVEEKYMDNYMAVFTKANYIFCSAAVPGQGGDHHVNEKTREYWIEKFSERGFIYDDETFNELIGVSAISNFVRKNALFLKKKDPITDIKYDSPFVLDDAESKINSYYDHYIKCGGAVIKESL